MTDQQANSQYPIIVPRSEHRISRADISDNALKVLYRLKNAGYQAYLVGGGVRDLSLGREPKDFDVATDAHPEEVRALFRNCRLIGRRFRLAHVHFGPEIIEVATFRALHDGSADNGDVQLENGRIIRDNAYGTLAEDAMRRDFTINALYYNIADFSVVDHAGGMQDLEHGVVRLIGDPQVRFREDPVRMLRAVRFAVKLGFRIESETAGVIPRMADLLEDVPAARLFDEILKLLMSGVGVATLEALRQYDVFSRMFPLTEASLARDSHGTRSLFIARALANTDQRIADGKPVTPAFLFAALLWPAVQEAFGKRLEEDDLPQMAALQAAADDVVVDQLQSVAIPKRFSVPMREVWLMQPRFERRNNRRAARMITHPRFRAAYDFLLLRGEAGEADPELVSWWREYVEREGGAPPPDVDSAPRRRRRRRRKPA
ncbi:poly(A) polymerase [Alkalilimnicola ehrlichii]|uniref:Poly(A) polymerase I n=1 Tax=Alkalilimnicola ehrlichii TaxID=351052 RepID=A0A3E0X1G8_9GAMM|nr:poly(A) polymerase [Alkalilimnicola ehrlichii]